MALRSTARYPIPTVPRVSSSHETSALTAPRAHPLDMIAASTSSPTWTQVEALPPKPSSAWTTSLDHRKTLLDVISEEVLQPVLGQGKDISELWEAYNRSLKVFSLLFQTLSELHNQSPTGPTLKAKQIGRLIAERTTELVPEELDIARMIQVALTNGRRARKVMARLQRKGVFDQFLKTREGGMWISASHGFPWGVFGLSFMAGDPEQYSKEDIYLCLHLIEAGPRDSFAFLRGYELELKEAEEEEVIEAGEMHEELARLEAEEFEEAERLLDRVEQGGQVSQE
jgi:hypothetical protein